MMHRPGQGEMFNVELSGRSLYAKDENLDQGSGVWGWAMKKWKASFFRRMEISSMRDNYFALLCGVYLKWTQWSEKMYLEFV